MDNRPHAGVVARLRPTAAGGSRPGRRCAVDLWVPRVAVGGPAHYAAARQWLRRSSETTTCNLGSPRTRQVRRRVADRRWLTELREVEHGRTGHTDRRAAGDVRCPRPARRVAAVVVGPAAAGGGPH